MTHQPTPGNIPLVTRAQPAAHAPKFPPAPWFFAVWMAAAALIAVAAGLVLGFLAAAELGIGSSRWTQSVQAHGRIQLFGLVATFVVALALEFLVRFYGRPPFALRIRVGLPATLGAGALLMAAGQIWFENVEFLAYAGALLTLLGAVGFAVLVWRIPLDRPVRVDPQPLFFRGASAWLAISAALALWGLAEAESGVVPLDISYSVAEVFLRGFVTFIIIGIGLRAIVGHVGLPPLAANRQLITYSILNMSLVAWLASAGLGDLDHLSWLERAADATFAGGLLLFIAWFGVLPAIRRGRGGPRYALIVPLAWVGATTYALLLLLAAVLPGGHDLNIYEDGAIRHTYLLGFVVPLMVAMAHIVLARYTIGFVPWENALTTGFYLLFAAWPLRTIPFLFEGTPSTASRWLLSMAGFMAMAGLILTAAVCLRAARLMALRLRPVPVSRHALR